jgi:hypothetical protein
LLRTDGAIGDFAYRWDATERALLPDFKSYLAQSGLCLCIVLLLILSEFAGFVKAFGFLKVTQNFSLFRGNSRKQMCREGEEVLCAKLLILCGVTKVVETRHEIFGLCLQTSALSSAPHEIKGQLSVEDNNVKVDNFSCSCKAGLSGTCKHISVCLLHCSRLYTFFVMSGKSSWPTNFYCDI